MCRLNSKVTLPINELQAWKACRFKSSSVYISLKYKSIIIILFLLQKIDNVLRGL